MAMASLSTKILIAPSIGIDLTCPNHQHSRIQWNQQTFMMCHACEKKIPVTHCGHYPTGLNLSAKDQESESCIRRAINTFNIYCSKKCAKKEDPNQSSPQSHLAASTHPLSSKTEKKAQLEKSLQDGIEKYFPGYASMIDEQVVKFSKLVP